jgi:hypothetical protein
MPFNSKGVKRFLIRLKYRIKGVPYYGRNRFCPVCSRWSRKFPDFGVIRRRDALCPHCMALERHRMLCLFLRKHTFLFDGRPKKLLHIAPEFCLEPLLRKAAGRGYLSADLDESRAMVCMDITGIDFPDASFDVIFCNHVLEHVDDDRKAMRELYRVLKKNGWAILMVPVTAEKTIEDPSVVTPEERLRVFGQEDHVRRYGPDFAQRLTDAGFEVMTAGAEYLASPDEILRMGLAGCSDIIFRCVKPD